MILETSELMWASDVKMAHIDWVWMNRIPVGTVTMLAGMPGLGKSTLLATIAASVTNGTYLPGEDPDEDEPLPERKPGLVIWLTSEEGNDTAIVPRLTAAKSNLSRVTVINQDKTQRSWTYDLSHTQSMQVFEAEIQLRKELLGLTNEPTLIVIDPIKSFKPGKDEQGTVRTFLQKLTSIAARQNAAIVGIMHFNKNEQVGDPMARFSGLLEWISVPRTGLVMAEHDNGMQKHLIIDTAKNNLSPFAAPLAFKLGTWESRDAETNKKIKVGLVEWLGVSAVNARDAMAPVERPPQKDPRKKVRAMKAIVEGLLDGPRVSSVLQQEIKEDCEVSADTVQIALTELGIVMGSKYRYRDPQSRQFMVALPELGEFPPQVEPLVVEVMQELGRPVVAESRREAA